MRLPRWLRHRRLSTRVVVAIVLVSSVVTCLVTVVQLYAEYRRDLDSLEQGLADARASFAGTLGASLWALDERQLHLQLRGLQSLPHVETVTLTGDLRMQVGSPSDYPYRRTMIIPVRHRTNDGVRHELGRVRVTASLAGIHARIWDRLVTILATQAAKTFVVSLLLLALIYWLVIRHLQTLAAFARALRLDRLDQPVALARPAGGCLRPDELDEMASSMNYATARMAEDMAARRSAERRHRLLSYALEQSPAGVLILDRDGRLDYANPRFELLSGISVAECHGQPCFGDDGWLYTRLAVAEGEPDPWETVQAGHEWQGEVRFRRGDGHYRWGRATVRPVPGTGGIQYIAVFEDVTQLRTVEERLDHQMHFDTLTGLPNRQLLQQFLATMIGSSGTTPCAVVLLDIDHFKTINESLGPDGGDRVLRAVAARLRGSIDTDWQVGRFGNDEFMLVVPGAWDPEELRGRLEGLLDALREIRFVDDQPLVLSVKAGAALCPGAGQRVPDLLRAADATLSAVKREAMRRVGVFREGDSLETRRRLTLDADLHRALANGELLLHYQPIVRVSDERTVALEALLRWQHPQHGLVPPDEFIGLAEDNGLIVPIGEWVLHQGLQTLAELRRRPGNETLQLAVNVSPRQLADTRFPDAVAAALHATGIPAAALQIELTERVFLGDVAYAGEALHRLESVGVELVVDDFGTGYSSLSYLKRLQVDVLKIDRSFIRDILHDAGDAQLVRAIISLAHNLGLRVVAEGVEHADEMAFLLGVDCEFAQGFYCARPGPMGDGPHREDRADHD
ncbi:EAL domain-containing protein [Aquisalimonas lutea]|uniref:bifunctional diguanylate cyclase/phosphodiesterase n=1 Tax=Aquisalimonas lutea TaxID=1327750 RepID=UPI0025B2F810|nr:EAL domain-containing protein [Aquisalimonas lutea]MDN3518186.1 EAL domain-containing protein [Aquisalimonas lutea]